MVALTENAAGGYTGEVEIGLSNLPASLTSDSFNVTTVTSGTTTLPTLTSTLKIPSVDVGTSASIFVAAEVGNSWYFNNGQQWVAYAVDMASDFPAFYTGQLNSSQSIILLSGIDVSGLKGTNIYVGYGQSAQVMLQKTQYTKTVTL